MVFGLAAVGVLGEPFVGFAKIRGVESGVVTGTLSEQEGFFGGGVMVADQIQAVGAHCHTPVTSRSVMMTCLKPL